ncbi:hypothetical protein ADUPG1_005525, partial [Aduncisulcus paluster]
MSTAVALLASSRECIADLNCAARCCTQRTREPSHILEGNMAKKAKKAKKVKKAKSAVKKT